MFGVTKEVAFGGGDEREEESEVQPERGSGNLVGRRSQGGRENQEPGWLKDS